MKTYKKIDLFYGGDYLCSTNQAKTCREAKKNYLERIRLGRFYESLLDKRIEKHPEQLKAWFRK